MLGGARSPAQGDKAVPPPTPPANSTGARKSPGDSVPPPRLDANSPHPELESSAELLRQDELLRRRDEWRKANLPMENLFGASPTSSARAPQVIASTFPPLVCASVANPAPALISDPFLDQEAGGSGFSGRGGVARAFRGSSSSRFSSQSHNHPRCKSSLAELGKQASDTFSFPVNPAAKELEQKALAARFPFDPVTKSAVKLKNTPIELHWNI